MPLRSALLVLGLLLALGTASLGCATPYTVTLRDGTIIETKDEPKFDEKTQFYELKTKSGKKMKVNRDELVSMESK